MIVMKFGGAALSSAEGFLQMKNILTAQAGKPLLVVISALSKTTSMLESAAKTAESGNENSAIKQLNSIISSHKKLCPVLIKSINAQKPALSGIEAGSEHLRKLLRGVAITRELTPRTLDAILSWGEMFALKIISAFLKENQLVIAEVDATKIIVTDDRFGKALPLEKQTLKNVENIIAPQLNQGNIVLTQGFTAATEDGQTTTMGIESSNLTTALLADMLGAKEIVYWTDVDGIRTADPKLIQNTKVLNEMSYDFALSAANKGLKLIFPTMINIAKMSNIRLVYRSAINPNGDFTVINCSGNETRKLMNIKEGVYRIKMALNDSNNSQVFLEKVFSMVSKFNFVIHLTYDNEIIEIFTQDAKLIKDKIFEDIESEKNDTFTCISVSSLSMRELSESLEMAGCSKLAVLFANEDWFNVFLPADKAKQAAREIHRRLVNN